MASYPATSVVDQTDLNQAADPIVCRCLQVRESEVVEAIEQHDLQTVREVRRHTGAGAGCNACHCALKQYLQQHRANPQAALPFDFAGSSASRLAG